VVAFVLMGVAGVACTDDGTAPNGAGGAATTTPPSASTEAIMPESVATSAAPSTEVPVVASTAEIVPVPDVGVPGIDSADPFCRAWSEFAGSFQALAFASSTSDADPAAALRLEVVASPAVSAAALTMADEFPDSVASEREVFLDDVIGPFVRRANRAADELRAAGVAASDLEQLGDVWLQTLVDAGVDDPEIVVEVRDGLTGAVDAATVVFAANVASISADPSLITQAEAPATFGYIADNCPDQGILAGNDAID
jgi:hypothetical protein